MAMLKFKGIPPPLSGTGKRRRHLLFLSFNLGLIFPRISRHASSFMHGKCETSSLFMKVRIIYDQYVKR